MSYDIIGDIHGQSDKLEALLHKLGYRKRAGAWRHASRTAIFVGDFIDSGPKGVETVRLVRDMVEAGSAQAVMGNHELNAVAWHTPDTRNDKGDYLRPRHDSRWGAKNRKQHAAFLSQVEHQPALHAELVNWFMTLPLWLELPELRVVHACWHQPYIEWLSTRLHDGRYLTPDLLVDATQEGDAGAKDAGDFSVFNAVEAVTKGIELPLPEGRTFVDRYGIARTHVRSRWWDPEATTYRQIALLSEAQRAGLPAIDVPMHARVQLADAKPTFFGHYALPATTGALLAPAVCVDHGAMGDGRLAAYRWDAGRSLSTQHFEWVS